jgi:hypothetical protein
MPLQVLIAFIVYGRDEHMSVIILVKFGYVYLIQLYTFSPILCFGYAVASWMRYSQ